MPNLDGFELTKRIKEEKKFSDIPVIALTTLSSDIEIQRGKEAGIDNYQIKLDRDKLLKSIRSYLNY
jgi:two-component system chemotaxis sensor kinase CheA